MGHLDLTIHEAKSLPAHRYYIKAFIIGDNWYQSKIKTGLSIKTTTPVWNQRYRFYVPNALASYLLIELYSYSRWLCDRDHGAGAIPLSSLQWNETLETWWNIGQAQIRISLRAIDFGIGAPESIPPTISVPPVVYINSSNNSNPGNMMMAGGLGFMGGLLLGELI
jgi:hypothetical protein